MPDDARSHRSVAYRVASAWEGLNAHNPLERPGLTGPLDARRQLDGTICADTAQTLLELLPAVVSWKLTVSVVAAPEFGTSER